MSVHVISISASMYFSKPMIGKFLLACRETMEALYVCVNYAQKSVTAATKAVEQQQVHV